MEASTLWLNLFRFMAASYVDERGATACLPRDGSAAAAAAAAEAEAAAPAHICVTYPGLAPAPPPAASALEKERLEQDALLAEALRHVDAHSLLPPIAVLSALSSCPHLPFGLVKDYIVRRLEREEERAREDKGHAASLASEAAAAKRECARLESSTRVFQSRSCAACRLDLTLPSVHFLCGGWGGGAGGEGGGGGGAAGVGGSDVVEHVFHKDCVTDMMGLEGSGSERLECPLCSAEHRDVRNIASGLGPRPGLVEQYWREVGATPDAGLFDKAAEYLSKGLMDVGSLGQGGR